MAVVSIVGTSGVGKSFLVKQLASLNFMPAFFEGEEGTIPKEIWKTVFTGSPIDRFKYFIDRYNNNLINARKASDAGLDAYVDGAVMSIDAVLRYEDPKYHAELQAIADTARGNTSDLIVLLTASHEKIRELLTLRGRTSEEIEQTMDRSAQIQDSFVALAEEYENVLSIDRTDLDFSDDATLTKVDAQIKEALG